jgi:hypothetical protein
MTTLSKFQNLERSDFIADSQAPLLDQDSGPVTPQSKTRLSRPLSEYIVIKPSREHSSVTSTAAENTSSGRWHRYISGQNPRILCIVSLAPD